MAAMAEIAHHVFDIVWKSNLHEFDAATATAAAAAAAAIKLVATQPRFQPIFQLQDIFRSQYQTSNVTLKQTNYHKITSSIADIR